MNTCFSAITLEDDEHILWQGEPQQRVSPKRWWYLLLVAVLFAAGAAGVEPFPHNDMVGRVLMGIIALGFAAAPSLLARNTNGSQYMATDRRLIVSEPPLLGGKRECTSYDYEECVKTKLEPMHNGLASVRFDFITHSGNKSTVHLVLLYAIPATIAETLIAHLEGDASGDEH